MQFVQCNAMLSFFQFAHVQLRWLYNVYALCRTVTQETVTQEVLGGAETHTSVSGVAHLSHDNDLAALRATRELFDFLPLSNR
jgi:Carboxyl transferase domain